MRTTIDSNSRLVSVNFSYAIHDHFINFFGINVEVIISPLKLTMPFHWVKGYCVDTVRIDAEMVRKYVKYQELLEKQQA